MRPSYLIILLVLNFFWAAGLSAYKFIEPYLEPGGIVTVRFGLACLSLLVLWPWLPGAAPRGRNLAWTGLLGLIVFVAGHRLQVLGNKLGTASNSSILMAIEPLITTVGAAIFLREQIGPRRMIGFAFGMLGVILLNGPWRPDFHWVSLGASLIFVTSFLSETAYSIIGKKIIQPGFPERETAVADSTERQEAIGPLKVLVLALVAGTLVNLMIDGPSTIAAAIRMPALPWLLLLAMALICTSLGYGFWFLVIREGEVNVAALTIFAQPVFGVALARLWLGESLHWGQFWGSTAIVVGLVIGLSRQIKPANRGQSQ